MPVVPEVCAQVAKANIEAATVQVANPDYDPDNIDPEVSEFLDVDGVGELVVFQSLGSSEVDDYDIMSPLSLDEYDFYMGARNRLDAVTTRYGTASIDSLTVNPDFVAEGEEGYDPEIEEFVNGVQQAAISLNTTRVTSDADENNIVTLGQMVSAYEFTTGFSKGYDVDLTPLDPKAEDSAFNLALENQAAAFAGEPATLDNVDWRHQPTGNDPSVANLDQVAALSLNTMTLGTAADEDEDIAASTANFDVWFEDYDLAGIGQSNDKAQILELKVNQEFAPIRVGNDIVATTDIGDLNGFADLGYDGFIENIEDLSVDYGTGDVNVTDISQAVSLTGNSISQLGEGTLTLKAQTRDSKDAVTASDFEQDLSYVEIFGVAGREATENYTSLNTVFASTDYGDIVVAGNADATEQVAIANFNAISSGGDLVSYSDDDWYAGIEQDADTFSIESDKWNYLRADNDEEGDVQVSEFDQFARLSLNSISAEGDIVANLSQEVGDMRIEGYGYDNTWNYADIDTEDGNATARDVTQTALASINTISAGGNITSDYVTQDFEGVYEEAAFAEGEVNRLSLFADDAGDARATGVDQFAQFSINTLSGTDLDSDLYQDLAGFDQGLSEDEALNAISVKSDDYGNAFLGDSSQTGIINLNVASLDGKVLQDVSQLFGYERETSLVYQNEAIASAYDDIAGLSYAGGNATIDGLDQVVLATVNSLTAGSLDSGYIAQSLDDNMYVEIGNYATADADYGVARADGIAQQAIARVNAISVAQAN
ncbi:hypothetical protein SAMN05661107_2460 [Maritimibacter sp. HL-12]|nr:hypothetical protein SAMN05661107_2460 [Maritimibacter sp. HL-12]